MAEINREVLGVVLASVFLWSGAAKAATPARLTDALTSLLGVGQRTGHVATVGFANLELAAAALLLFAPAAMVTTALSAALGLSILGTSLYVLTTGRALTCGCFGSLSSKPIGWSNAAFGAAVVVMSLAPVLLWRSSAITDLGASAFSFGRVAAVACLVPLGLLVTHRRLLLAPLSNFAARTTAT